MIDISVDYHTVITIFELNEFGERVREKTVNMYPGQSITLLDVDYDDVNLRLVYDPPLGNL